MLPLLYFISSFLVLLAIANKKRPISPTSVFGLGTIIYGLPLYTGETHFTITFLPEQIDYSSEIDGRIYIIFFVCQLTFFIANFIFSEKPIERKIYPDELFLFSIVLSLIICSILMLVTLGGENLFIEKLERMQYLTVFYDFSSTLCVASFIFYVLYGQKRHLKYLIFPVLFIALDLFMGYRGTLVLGAISTVLAYYGARQSSLKLSEKQGIAIFLLSFLFFAFVYKPVYYTLLGGNFDPENFVNYIQTSLPGSEPFIITGVLNEVIKIGVQLPPWYFLNSLFQYVPFYVSLSNSERASFNLYSQGQLFPEVEWGLASTAFGELYALGGLLLIFIFLMLMLLFLGMKPPKHPYLVIMYYYILPYILFYFHRNDWHAFIDYIRLYLITSLLVFIVYGTLKLFISAVKEQVSKKKSAFSPPH